MLAVAVLVIAEILSPPPAVAGADPDTGAWIAFAAALAMVAGAVLSLGRVSFSMAIEGREPRQRVAAVDHRPPTTERRARPWRRREETEADRRRPADEGGDALMADTREPSFELERFEWVDDDRLEVVGPLAGPDRPPARRARCCTSRPTAAAGG